MDFIAIALQAKIGIEYILVVFGVLVLVSLFKHYRKYR